MGKYAKDVHEALRIIISFMTQGLTKGLFLEIRNQHFFKLQTPKTELQGLRVTRTRFCVEPFNAVVRMSFLSFYTNASNT